jgi:RNA polymerase sigma factor (TIGR02999 family)
LVSKGLARREAMMPGAETSGVTQLLLAWRGGDESALEKLTPIVYEELHRIARRCMAGERGEHSLQATALVNEAYLRLVDTRRVRWQGRSHFYAIAARLMRRILVDHARSRDARKRGGDARRVSLDETALVSPEPEVDLVDLDAALRKLAAQDPRKERVVELRFFAGLDVQETAEVLEVSPDTVMRDWRLARAWLARELERDRGE